MGLSAPYVAAVLADAPVGYWRLNDGTGPAASNQIGGGAAGTYNGIFSLGQVGPFDDATVAFFPTSGYMKVPIGTFVSFAHFTFEFICRVLPAQACYMMMLENGGGVGANASFDVFLNPAGDFSEDVWATGGGAAFNNYGLLPYGDGRWHHIAATFGGGNVALFVDGNQDAVGTPPSGPNAIANPFFELGGWGSRAASATTRANGEFGEFAYYNVALSAARAKAHFQALALNSSFPIGQPPDSGSTAVQTALLNEILAAVKRTY